VGWGPPSPSALHRRGFKRMGLTSLAIHLALWRMRSLPPWLWRVYALEFKKTCLRSSRNLSNCRKMPQLEKRYRLTFPTRTMTPIGKSYSSASSQLLKRKTNRRSWTKLRALETRVKLTKLCGTLSNRQQRNSRPIQGNGKGLPRPELRWWKRGS
jgi:hypothetical protein